MSVLNCATGIDCSAAVAGDVTVFGSNPDINAGATNTAMIFDSECVDGNPANCSGGDDDLFFPGHGNTLIISEDLDITDPDDADVFGSMFEFDFSGWGVGAVTVNSIDGRH